MMYLQWILYFIPALLVEVFCYLLSPFVAFFITSRERTDRVKLIDNKQHTLMRDYLIKPLYWFQTHDNAADEWWYGAFYKDSYFPFIRNKTQEDYDSKAWLRYVCRVHWLLRNNAYGFHYTLFSKPVEPDLEVIQDGIKKYTPYYRITKRQNSFQVYWHPRLFGTNRYTSINIGWKKHDDKPKMLYANRIIGGIRKYK